MEISAVADKVMPEYEDEVLFVNAITDDPSSRRLASRFDFQYIPTSYFVRGDGSIADSRTGPMTEQEMRAALDRLVGE